MYIPKINLLSDRAEAIEFMQRFSFASIITAPNGLPVATHLPFLASERDGSVILTSHFARANGQWKDITDHKVLVIFSEPHAYISPRHYDQELSVPTWNYISIHAYGEGTIVPEEKKVIEILESTINTYELAYRQQWNRLPDDYKLGMIKGIVAFEIKVTELQGKKKLSQNKTEQEQARIIDTLSKSESTTENLVAEYMRKNSHDQS
jgi:transcriptional regulator